MNALAWLNDLMQWIGRWVPRLTLVPPTHGGVRFGPRGEATPVGPGIVVWWPLIHQLRRVPITAQNMTVAPRALPRHAPSFLPEAFAVAFAVQYRIVDPVLAATTVGSTHALVDNRVQAAAVAKFMSLDGLDVLSEAMLKELGDLARYGVLVERVDASHAAAVTSLMKLSGDFAYDDSVAVTDVA